MKKSSLSLSLLWLGIVLLFSGIVLTTLGAYFTTWALLAMMGGTLGILLYVVLNYGEVRDFFVEYSTRQWANTIVFVVLLVGIVIVIQMIANHHNRRFDLTPKGDLSLAPITKKVLQDVAYPVKAIGFYKQDERAELYQLFELYRMASDKFTYELHDLDRNPGLAKKYEVGSYGTAVVEVNNKKKSVTYPTEEKLINAVLSLLNPQPKVIYFLAGHSEYPLEDPNEEVKSYCVFKQALESENYQVKSLLFVEGKPIPDDAALVVIGGPKATFSRAELAQLDAYVRKGGKLIVASDPGPDYGLKGFLADYGIDLGDDIVVDTEDYLIEKNPLVPVVPFYLTHPITENFTRPTVYPLVRSVNKGKEPKGLSISSLARSGEKSWAASDVGSAEAGQFEYNPRLDQKGPVTIAVVAETRKEAPKRGDSEPETPAPQGGQGTEAPSVPPISGKVVVFGDSDFLLNRYFSLLGNKDFILNSVHWLTEDEPLISIRDKKPASPEDAKPFFLSPVHSRLILIGTVILQPLLVLAIGMVVAWKRRQKG